VRFIECLPIPFCFANRHRLHVADDFKLSPFETPTVYREEMPLEDEVVDFPHVKGGVKVGHWGGAKVGQLMGADVLEHLGRRASGA
jgi:hypothetical protein